MPENRARLTDDFEAYWREQHLNRPIRQARNTYRHSEIRVDGDGDGEWTISMWAQFWGSHTTVSTQDAADRILAWRYLRDSRRYRSLCLIDRGVRVAGDVIFIRDEEAIGMTTFRDRNARGSPGVRLMEASFFWARAEGYKYMNLGPGFSYKAQWAPEDGASYCVSFEPLLYRALRNARDTQRKVAGAMRQPATWARTRLR